MVSSYLKIMGKMDVLYYPQGSLIGIRNMMLDYHIHSDYRSQFLLNVVNQYLKVLKKNNLASLFL